MRAEAETHDLLIWKHAHVDRRLALYGEAGEGLPVLFLHGWALGRRSYKPALRRLVSLGCHVWAPALPGFGGTPELPGSQLSFMGYAGWVERFCEAVGITGPVVVIGHSFGGAVGIRLAYDYPDRAAKLVLIDSIGGPDWLPAGANRPGRTMAQRPLWDWGLHARGDILPFPPLNRLVPVVVEEALPNVIRNPLALWKVGQLARRADLTEEAVALHRRGLPVIVLWAEKDQIVPPTSNAALCDALGVEGRVIARAAHSWLLADPEAFAEVMAEVLHLEPPEAEDLRSASRPVAG